MSSSQGSPGSNSSQSKLATQLNLSVGYCKYIDQFSIDLNMNIVIQSVREQKKTTLSGNLTWKIWNYEMIITTPDCDLETMVNSFTTVSAQCMVEVKAVRCQKLTGGIEKEKKHNYATV